MSKVTPAFLSPSTYIGFSMICSLYCCFVLFVLSLSFKFKTLIWDVRMQFALDLFISLNPTSQSNPLLYTGDLQIFGVKRSIIPVPSHIQNVGSSPHMIPSERHSLKYSKMFNSPRHFRFIIKAWFILTSKHFKC